MGGIREIEKILADECQDLIAIYNNLYDEVSGEIKKRKRRLKIKLFFYILIYIILAIFILYFKEWLDIRCLLYFRHIINNIEFYLLL